MAKPDTKDTTDLKARLASVANETSTIIKEMTRLEEIETKIRKRLATIDQELLDMESLRQQTECRGNLNYQMIPDFKLKRIKEALALCDYIGDWKLKTEYEKKK